MSSERVLKENPIRVLVADNSRMHTRLLADALKRDQLLEVIPFESDPSGLIGALTTQAVDVLVISSNFDEHATGGLEILQELRARKRHTRTVLLLGSSKEEVILRAFRAGARGLFSKNDPLEHLSECVRSVHLGKVWANPQALAVAVEALANSPTVPAPAASKMKLLSKRELQVVRSLAEGLTNREIAEQLSLSPHTVKNYLFRIFDKLGVSSRIELLFMTLSQAETALDASQVRSHGLNGHDYSRSESALIEKSAEAGIPAAQLALAQMHLSRRKDPQDLIEAYMWYLVATERALLARAFITKMLTPEQIEEAKTKASVWLSRFNRSIPNPEATASQTM